MNIDVKNNIDFDLVNDLNTTILINEKVEKKNENDIDTLLTMGFDQKMAKKVYVLLKPNNIDEAIYLLTQDDGKYHHYFIERHGKPNQCFICGLGPEKHLNFIRKSIYNENRENKTNKIEKELNEINEPLMSTSSILSDESQISEEEIKKPQSCDICYEDISKKEKRENYLPCKHFFCSDCYLNYLQKKITHNEVGSITCMQKGCTYELDEKFIQSHLKGDKDLFDKYLKFKKRYELIKNQKIVLCPNENCESYANKEENNIFVKCLDGHAFCSICLGPWHIGKQCKIGDLESYGKEHHLKKCPRCGALTEKNMGCNHMKCNCGCNWCWFCRNEFENEYEHFGVNGPCANLHFTGKEFYNNCFCLCIHNTWIKVMHQLLLLFIITSLPSAYFLRKTKSDFYNDDSFKKCLRFLRLIGIFYSIGFFGLFLPIGFVLFIICLCANQLKRKIIRYILDLEDKEPAE